LSKKLLFFASSKGIGLTYHLTVFSKYIKLKYNDVVVLSGNKEQYKGLFDELDESEIKYYRVNGLDEIKNFLRNIKGFLNIVKSENPYVLHAQTNTHLFYCLFAKMIYGKKIIYTIHSYRNSKGNIREFLMSIALSVFCNLFVDYTNTLSSIVRKHFNNYFLKTDFLTLGYELPPPRLSFNTEFFTVIYAAKFNKSKRHLKLLEALIPILKKHNDIKVILPGDGETLKECKELVKENCVNDNILFPGWVDRNELETYYLKASIAVVTSKSENGGHAIVEPLAYSLPLISTKVGIAPDVIVNNENGYLYDIDDMDNLRKHILYFYNDREKIIKFGKKSYDIALEKLSWEKISEIYVKVLNEI
jgi:glycosyltransferase involved in cell wall biosynthesis